MISVMGLLTDRQSCLAEHMSQLVIKESSEEDNKKRCPTSKQNSKQLIR